MQFQSTLAVTTILILASMQSNASDVLDELDGAKRIHQDSVTSVNEDYCEWMLKRKQTARNKGDITEVREYEELEKAFEDSVEIPPSAPDNVLGKLSKAHRALESAYQLAIRDLTRQTEDAVIAALERELQEFVSATTAFKYLVDIEYESKRHYPDAFSTNGVVMGNDVIFDGMKFPKTLFCHPSQSDFSEVVYPIHGEWDKLSGKVGALRPPDLPVDKRLVTALSFEIIADEKRVWRSTVRDYNRLEAYDISVRKVKQLVFRVQCPGSNVATWSVWVDPMLSRRK